MKFFILSVFLFVTYSTQASKGTLVFFKGKVQIHRSGQPLKVKKKMKLKSGDIITSGKRSMAIVKSKFATIKVMQKSRILLDFPKNKELDATIDKGGAVVKFIRKLKTSNREKRPEEQVTVRTRTASMGVRGTTFMAFVGKDENSILSVKKGLVKFQGNASQKGLEVAKNLSTMTNKNSQTITQKNYGIVNKVNWEMDDMSKDLFQSNKLFSHLDKVWKNYKHAQEVKWSDYKGTQDKKWKNWSDKQQGFKGLNN